MKYAIKFYQECGILDEVDELIIKYFERNINIFDFIENHKNQRIIMDITEHLEYKSDLDIFKALKEKYNNFSLMLSTTQVSFVDTLINAGISFFFAQGAVTPDMLEYFLNMGVSDVYIMNEMCFNLKEISKICKEKNVKIRVFPNIAQSSTTDIEDSDIVMNTATFFFIRPEDLDVYEQYVDVYEFYGPLDTQPVNYDIYKNKRKWDSSLSLLIYNLEEEFYGDAIIPIFGKRRAECNKRCIYNNCTLCKDIAKVSENMANINAGFGVENEY